MKDIKEKIKSSGYHVHIINALSDGIEYADLQTDLEAKGCDLTTTDLQAYHKTMTNYEASKQLKTANLGENLGSGDFEQILKDAETKTIYQNDVDKMLNLLHNLFVRQVQIVFNLQSEYLGDDLMLINNELKNLTAIKAIYFDALKLSSRGSSPLADFPKQKISY